MLRRIGWTALWAVAALVKGRRGSQPVTTPAEDDDDDFVGEDNELDCTGTIHRRYCRKFDREVVNDLYWKSWDEVSAAGSYLKTYGGFHVPQCILLVPHPDGHMVEFANLDQGLDKEAAYLGPLPALPTCLPFGGLYVGDLHE